MPHVTDISHLIIGSYDDSPMTRTDQHSCTNITDLYNTPDPEPEHRKPCVIRCTDILSHIKTCPVCSKLYMPIPKQGSGKWSCENGSCYKTSGSGSTVVNQRNMNIMLMILAVIFLLFVRMSLFTGEKKTD
jgi:hypothetical protein